MLKLYEAGNLIEAQILRDHLSDAGVEAVILGDYLTGAIGELPANIYPEVWILDAGDREKARQLVLDFTNGSIQTEHNGNWRCSHCGEWVEAGFEICWNCATPRKRQE